MNKVDISKFNVGDLGDVEEKAIASLREDPDVYHVIHDELELTGAEVKMYLGTLIDLQEDMRICKECPGLESCPKAHPAFCLKLGFVEGQLSRFYEPCKKKQVRDEMLSRFFIRDFDEAWMDKTVRDVDRTDARKQLIRELGGVSQGKEKNWLYVTGKHRQGKTFILAVMAKQYGKDHRPVGFASTSKLIENMKEKAIKEKEKFEKNMRLLETAPLLVLDEFGNEFKSEFVFSTIVYPLLSARAKKNLPTWFTSDFSIEEVVDMYQSKIGSPRAKQLKRLLEDHCEKEIVLEGVSVY